MGKHSTVESLETNLLSHPAVSAWGRLRQQHMEPDRIETLYKKRKTQVYRLSGVAWNPPILIAKRSQRNIVAIERIIYEQVLQGLPVTALRYLGYAEDDEQFCWLFLEDAGGDKYSPQVTTHRELAARWLAAMHSSAETVAAAASLPDRSSDYYLEELRSSRDRMIHNFTNPVLGADDPSTLKTLVSHCSVLERHWGPVAEFCSRMPRTLVHGDFTTKNVRIRSCCGGTVLLVMDWEHAGWGVPATDLAQWEERMLSPDLLTYWLNTQQSWPHLDLGDVQRLAQLGGIFRLIMKISWATANLRPHWVLEPMQELTCYEERLGSLILAAGLGS